MYDLSHRCNMAFLVCCMVAFAATANPTAEAPTALPISNSAAPTLPVPGVPETAAVRAASYVIAAADAPARRKSAADFICPGTNDHLVINSAIASLAESGGHVHLTAGTYSIGAVTGTYGGICILRSNVILTGEGSATRLILQEGLADVNVIWIHGDIRDIAIRDLFIDGRGQTQQRTQALGWRGCNGIKAVDDRNGLGPTPCNVRIENCHIENCRLMAVMLSGKAAEVINCFFTGNFGSHVVEILGDSGRIEGCTLQIKKGESAGYGFSTDASYHYHIVNNKIFIEPGGAILAHPINNWPAVRYGGGTRTNLYYGIIAGNIVVNNGKTRSLLIDGYMDMVNNNIFRGVPVVLGAPEGGIGMIFEHNLLINSPLEINAPLRGDECRIFVNGNQFFNSPVKHVDGNVIWGVNPGYVTVNAGMCVIPGEQTAVTVTHCLAAAPAVINVTPLDNMGAAAKFWVDTVTDRNFTIRLDSPPGSAPAKFNWQAAVEKALH